MAPIYAAATAAAVSIVAWGRRDLEIVLADDDAGSGALYRATVRTPPLAAILVFVALLTAISMLRGAVRSHARPPSSPPAEVHHHPTSPFDRVPAW